LDAFGEQHSVDSKRVAEWLHRYASLATPHSQRSEAHVSVDITDNDETLGLGLLPLIDRIEHAVCTPVQTAVKRADEQAFAALNGQNLMFVEDAARRIEAALRAYSNLSVYVRHMESLHPHDAVAWTTSSQERVTA
jgi:GTP cyclohydrolase I